VSHVSHRSGAEPPVSPRRRSGREGPQELTAAFRRYVDRVQSVAGPTPRTDLHAALRLAVEVTGCTGVEPSVVAAQGSAIHQLARGVRQAGPGAAAQPALLARAIVLGRALAASSADVRADRRVLAGASR
jgi:hypothetical protein